MGRPAKDIDMEIVLDLLERGENVPAISSELGISAPTLRSRIADLEKKQGLLLQYRAIQSLQLTELQARVLEAITPQKIEEAPLRDLVASYKILKQHELVIEGKPSEVKGLIAHLIYMEKQEKGLVDSSIEDAEYSDNTPSSPAEEFNSLAALDDQNF